MPAPCAVVGCDLPAAQPVEIRKPENIPHFGRIPPKFVRLDHMGMIGRGDTWIYDSARDGILMGIFLEEEHLIAVDSIGTVIDALAYSPEFGNFKRLRIAGRSIPSGDPQGMQLILTPQMENEIVELAKLLRREES